MNISDFGYFSVAQRRLLYEPYTMLPDIIRMIPSAISYHYILFFVFIIGCIVFTFISTKIFSKFQKSFLKRKTIFEVVSLMLITLLAVISIRGGFQLKPLRQANAFYTDSRILGYLTLNSTYNVILSAFQDALPHIYLIPKSQANEIVRDVIKDDKDIFDDTGYIFLRKKITETEPRKLNVVIFIMESWSSKFSGSITGGKTFTPFFDSLSASGILFNNFFANAQRSIEAVPSIIASVPSLYDISIINSVAEMNNYRGIGSILKENGYSTSFFHGAVTGSMGFDGFSKIAGFTDYYGKENFAYLPVSDFDGTWGICDEPFFLEAGKKFNSFNKPFCSVIFSLSSHDPYKIPNDRLQLFEKYKDESDFERSIRYSDFCLKKFFEQASKEDWFNNTLFILTSDHTLFNSREDFYSTFHSLLFLYTPSGILKPSIYNRIASHADMLPTILDVLQISAIHASMGKSAFSQNPLRYCFEKYGNDYCIINDDYALLNDLEHEPKLYHYKTDPSLKNNLTDLNREISDELNTKLLAYVETVTYALTKNKIYK